MLNLLDESMEEFLRATVPLPREVEVAFAAPDKDWSARVSKPTINLYLWDVRRNVSERELGVELVPNPAGRPSLRAPLPRVDCRYLVTAWTSDIRDEHALLGATLSALLLHSELAPEYLRGAYRDVVPVPRIEVGAGDGTDNSDFWSALGGQLKPGLDVTVTATVAASLPVQVGPPVERYAIVATPASPGGPAEVEPERRLFVAGHAEPGSIVSTPHGATLTEDGTYLVPAEVGDDISIDGEPRHRVGDAALTDIPKRRKPGRGR